MPPLWISLTFGKIDINYLRERFPFSSLKIDLSPIFAVTGHHCASSEDPQQSCAETLAAVI
jgi:hypothetical protein